jgi:hypothetical protein
MNMISEVLVCSKPMYDVFLPMRNKEDLTFELMITEILMVSRITSRLHLCHLQSVTMSQ